MPVPFLLAGAAAVAGLTGVVKGGQAISNNSKAKEIIEKAERKYNRAKDSLEEQRNVTSYDLERLGETKLYSWSNDIGRFISVFKQFKKVEIEGNPNLNEKLKMKITDMGSLGKMEVASLKATEVMKAGVSSLGAGALAGIASYGGAMMFASASTGTAIATLSGAAATNATLAWFGGGSLAAGGLGMAGGTAVLGGIVAGPVLAVAGFVMAAKSEENLANAKKTESEVNVAVAKMNTMKEVMEKISDISDDYNSFIIAFSERYQPFIHQINDIYNRAYNVQKDYFFNKVKNWLGISFKIDFRKLSVNDQKVLQASWLMTQVLYAVLSAPLLNNNGDVDGNAEQTLIGAKESTQNLIGVNM